MNGIDGIVNPTDGQDASDAEVNITIDKDKARLSLIVPAGSASADMRFNFENCYKQSLTAAL